VIVELAIATGIAPSVWWEQDEGDVMTALEILERQAEQLEQTKRGGR